jgi:capsular polysaccharide biosynthesis protein
MNRKLTGASLAGAALALAMVAPVAAANQAGNSLVNVQISDVTIAVPIAIAANICDVNVNVLAEQLDAGDAACTATAESIATPGTGDGRGGNRAGNSLINVQVDDLTVLLPIAIAANVCDVNVNVLATQLRLGDVTCDAAANAEA